MVVVTFGRRRAAPFGFADFGPVSAAAIPVGLLSPTNRADRATTWSAIF